MRGDPVLLAKLKTMGITTRALVWRLGQSISWAAAFHGRSEYELSSEWFDKAVLLGDVIDAKLPPLFEPTSDRARGSALAVKYVLTTVGPALKEPVVRFGRDHLALLECSLKLCFVDLVGGAGGEMLEAIAGAVRATAAAGGLPQSFQKRIDQIVAEVGRDASKLIVDAYGEAFAYLKRQDAISTGAPELASAASTPARASTPKPAASLVSIPDTPAGTRKQIYRLATYLASTACYRPYPEDQDKAEARMTVASESAATLGVELPPMPPLTGKRGKDLADNLMYLVMDAGNEIKTSLAKKHGDAQGALFEGLALMSVWMQFYSANTPKKGASFYMSMIAALSRAGLPSHLWAELVTIGVGRPDDEAFDKIYSGMRRRIRLHLQSAAGMS